MKKKIKNILGFTLVEILIGVVISSIMMAAMFTTYTVVNNSYSQVSDVAGISRSGRDIVSMMMRDIRMAGFKYHYGLVRAKQADGTMIQIGDSDIPEQDYLQFILGDEPGEKANSHAPIVIYKNTMDYDLGGTEEFSEKRYLTVDGANIGGDTRCCDRIHIVYGDFDINDRNQPYKRYRISYFAKRMVRTTGDAYYGVFRSLESWEQPIGEDEGDWVSDCDECYNAELIREYLVDMEFVAVDKDGLQVKTDPETDPDDLYTIRSVDVRLTFRSSAKKGYFKKNIARIVKSFDGVGTFNITDPYLRDSVFVTVHTRNIGGTF